MPATDLLNPVTPILGGAALSSANAIPVKVISSAAATGITINSTTITGGTTTRALYDNGGTVGEAVGIAYASATAITTLTQLTYGGVAFASTAVGSGSLVGATNPTLSSLVITGTMTYGGVTYASTVTGTGSNVLATNPTLSSLIATGTLTYGGVALASTVTGTGSMVLSASPTLSGTASFAATVHSGLATFSSAQTTVGTGTFQNGVAASIGSATNGILFSSTASFGIMWGALGSVAPTVAVTQGTLLINTSGSSIASRMFVRTSSSWASITTAA